MATVGYLRYPHTVDIYEKVTTTNDAGQKIYTFQLDRKIPAIVNSPEDQYSAGTKVRTAPYQEFFPVLQMIVPGMYAATVITSSRVLNIKDRYGNVLETGPFEIITVQPKFGWNGKKHHLLVSLRTVVEQS
jgi:hypothetical protein